MDNERIFEHVLTSLIHVYINLVKLDRFLIITEICATIYGYVTEVLEISIEKSHLLKMLSARSERNARKLARQQLKLLSALHDFCFADCPKNAFSPKNSSLA